MLLAATGGDLRWDWHYKNHGRRGYWGYSRRGCKELLALGVPARTIMVSLQLDIAWCAIVGRSHPRSRKIPKEAGTFESCHAGARADGDSSKAAGDVDSALPWPSRNDDNANEVADVAAVGGTISSGEGVPSVADYDAMARRRRIQRGRAMAFREDWSIGA